MESAKKNIRQGPPRYDDDIKKKCIELALKGMNVEEIVKSVKGPKQRAVMRYLRHAEVQIKR
ncbi:MAG: hypothetical protein Q8N99_08790 [Nanoarchaeota archaeon]|nr:hypothetical protein [Nanoarchaeota archaeon]